MASDGLIWTAEGTRPKPCKTQSFSQADTVDLHQARAFACETKEAGAVPRLGYCIGVLKSPSASTWRRLRRQPCVVGLQMLS